MIKFGNKTLGQCITKGTCTPNLQNKNITPSAAQQKIIADEGYDGLGEVVVDALPLHTKVVNYSNEEQLLVPDEGYIGFSSVLVPSAKVIEEVTYIPQATANDLNRAIIYNGELYICKEVN